MKLTSVFIILFVVSFCGAENIFCSTKNGSETYSFYCNNTIIALQNQKLGNCSEVMENSTIHEIHWHDVKFHKCNVQFVLKTSERVQNLTGIDLSYSGYASLESMTLKLSHLQRINASHNELSEIPRQIFENNNEISVIDFSYNKLKRIESNTFDAAIKLTNLNLSHNDIRFIDESAFVNLSVLEYIDLSDNHIQSLEMLNNNKNLKLLVAMNNPLSFDCHNFSRIESLSVQISWKNVEFFNTNCKSMQFKVIVNGTDEGVWHKSRGQYEIRCDKESMTQLSYFMAGRNRVENVNDFMECFTSSMQKMVLSNNFVGKLNVEQFQRFKNLELLHLRETRLTEFDFEVLKNQPKLNKLDISDNGLTQLHNFSTLINFDLMEFKATGNQLENTQEIVKYLKSSVKVLDVSDNFVGQIQSTTFERLTNLFMLKLSNTNLSIIDSDPFEKAKDLTILDVSHNDLGMVNFTAFSSTLKKLTRIFAANCHIENATDMIQHLGSSLLELDLSGNRLLEEIDDNTFKTLTHLESLHLNNTNLSQFNFSVLKPNKNLKNLKLCDNKLHDMDFSSLPESLTRLDLEGNDLETLDNFNLSKYPQLEYLGISNNWLSCDYVIQFRKTWKGLKFIGDPLKQKHHKDCRRSVQSSVGVEAMLKSNITITFAMITIGILTVIIVIVTLACYLYYKKKKNESWDEKALKRIRKSMQNSELYGKTVELPTEDCNDDQMYEEIPLSNDDYDHLRYETDPLPVSNSDEHYHNFSIISANGTRRSLTSRI